MAGSELVSTVARRQTWPEDLAAFFESRRSAVFAWGEHDCGLFAADAITAMTGSDLIGSLRGRYKTARGAARLLNRMGGLRGAATAILGEPFDPRRAHRGDVVLLSNEGRECLGVCNGTVAAAPGARGIAWLSMDDALAAWRVG